MIQNNELTLTYNFFLNNKTLILWATIGKVFINELVYIITLVYIACKHTCG